MPLEEVPCSSPRPNSQRARNTVCSLESYALDVHRFPGPNFASVRAAKDGPFGANALCPCSATVRIFWSEVGIEVLRPAQMTSCNGGRYKLRGRFSAEVGSRSSVIGRVNHPRRDLARSIGVCPA